MKAKSESLHVTRCVPSIGKGPAPMWRGSWGMRRSWPGCRGLALFNKRDSLLAYQVQIGEGFRPVQNSSAGVERRHPTDSNFLNRGKPNTDVASRKVDDQGRGSRGEDVRAE